MLPREFSLKLNKLIFLILCCFLGGYLLGCSPPKAIETFEYHLNYDRMSEEYDPPVSLVKINPEAHLRMYKNVVVGKFEVGEGWVKDTEKASHLAGTYFRQVLARELLESGSFYVSLDPEFTAETPTAVFEGKLTVFDPGSGSGRFLSYVFFFLQSVSAVDLQVEGRIRDARTEEVLVDFADRRKFLGHTPWGPTPNTLNDDWAMKQTCILTARALANLLAYLRGEQEI